MKSLLFFFLLCGISVTVTKAQIPQSIAMPSGYTSSQLRPKNCLFTDQQNNYWIGFSKIGLARYDGSWTVFDSLNSGFSSNNCRSIAQLNNGNIVMCTSSNVSVYNGSNWQHFDHLNSALPQTGITVVTTDGNNIWIGTSNGVFRYDGNTWTGFNTSNSSLINDTITCLSSQNGIIGVGTRNGVSVYRQGVWTSVTTGTVYIENNINDIAVNSSNEVWFTTNTGKAWYIESNGVNLISFQSTLPQQYYVCQSDTLSFVAIESDGNSTYLINNLSVRLILKISSTHQIIYTEQPLAFPLNSMFDIFNSRLTSVFVNFGIMDSLFILDLNQLNFEPLTSYFYNRFVMDVNQVKALIKNDGSMHWDPIGQTPLYDVPKCSFKQPIYSSGFWIGGFEVCH